MIGWILLGAALLALIAVGIKLTNFACRGRPLPDPTDPEQLKASNWAYLDHVITPGVQWFQTQEVRELRVVSYDNQELFGWFVPCENARATIVMVHGYRSHPLVDFSGSLTMYHKLGFNLLLVHQRALNRSGGKYITFGVRERFDVVSWVTYLSLMLGEEHPIFLTGVSMGASTILMASDMEMPGNVRGLIADCGFTSPWDILAHICRQQYHVPGWLGAGFLAVFTRLFAGFGLRQWSTQKALAHSRYPVFLAHGLDDDFVPPWMSRASYDVCTGEKVLFEAEGAGHGLSFLVDPDGYKGELLPFLERHLGDAGVEP